MKCSECSKVVRPVVALDIDGTLGNYHNHFYSFVTGWLGQEPPSTDYGNNLGLTTYNYRQAKLAYRQGGMKRTMPMFWGADVMTRDLRERGVELWVCTTRPYNRLDNIDPDTQEWLRRNNIAWDYVIYDPDKYEQLAQMVDPARVVAVLEDLPDQCERAARLFGRGAVVRRYNGWVTPGMASDLVDHFVSIQEKLITWREQHG